jgi:hypothetical protein
MIGGSMKTTSRFALAAVAGLLMGGVYGAPAQAADLGGNCCADLEERVAELEATTVRKGNRKMSLTLSGHVNRGIMWYDDGSMTGTRFFDQIMSHSRFRLLGSAKINADWTMGYYQEFEFSTASNFGVSQLDDRGFNSAGGNLQGSSPFNFAIRQSHWYLKNNRLGTVSVGRLNMATKDMPGTELGNIAIVTASDFDLQMGSFLLRPVGGVGRQGLATTRLSAFRTQSSADNLRTDGLRYDSPTIMGYTLSAAVGDDYIWDVALRYSGDWNGFKIASAVGYYVDMDEGLCNASNAGNVGNPPTNGCLNPVSAKGGRREQTVFKSNSSILHQPSGLFASWAYWKLEHNGFGNIDQNLGAGAGSLVAGAQRPDSDMYWVAAGIRRNWFGIGDTSVFMDYGRINDAAVGGALNLLSPSGVGTNFGIVTDTTLTRWGVGITQNVDAANSTLYLHYINYSPEVSGCAPSAAAPTVARTSCAATVKQELEDIRSVNVGAIVRF